MLFVKFIKTLALALISTPLMKCKVTTNFIFRYFLKTILQLRLMLGRSLRVILVVLLLLLCAEVLLSVFHDDYRITDELVCRLQMLDMLHEPTNVLQMQNDQSDTSSQEAFNGDVGGGIRHQAHWGRGLLGNLREFIDVVSSSTTWFISSDSANHQDLQNVFTQGSAEQNLVEDIELAHNSSVNNSAELFNEPNPSSAPAKVTEGRFVDDIEISMSTINNASPVSNDINGNSNDSLRNFFAKWCNCCGPR